MFHHWLNRQKEGLVPFQLLNCSPLHTKAVKSVKKGKKKAKADWEDVSSSDDDKEEDNDDVMKVDHPLIPTAGSSTLPPPKHVAKKKRSKSAKARTEEQVDSPPIKIGPPKHTSKVKSVKVGDVEQKKTSGSKTNAKKSLPKPHMQMNVDRSEGAPKRKRDDEHDSSAESPGPNKRIKPS